MIERKKLFCVGRLQYMPSSKSTHPMNMGVGRLSEEFRTSILQDTRMLDQETVVSVHIVYIFMNFSLQAVLDQETVVSVHIVYIFRNFSLQDVLDQESVVSVHTVYIFRNFHYRMC